jgi:PAS domain S-box-containing protein
MMVDDLGVVMISNHPGRFLFSLGPLSESEKKGLSESNKFLGKEIKPLQYGPVKDVLKNYVSPQSVSMFDAIDNEQEILYIQKIGDLPFFLIVEMGLNDVEKAVLNVVLITSAAVLLAALLVACLGYWSVARLFVGPFRELGEATRRISLGDFSYRISINTKDELEDLADTMNTMSQKLGNYYKDLDDQVKEKTAEIEEKNKKLAEQQKVVLNILGEVKAEKIRAEVLAAIVKDADEPIIGEDLNRIITSWNHGAEKLYGYLASEVVGKPIDIIVPDDKKVELDKILKSVAAGKSVSHIQTVRKKKDGSLVEVLLSVAPVRDASGKVVGTSAIASDITKEKQIDRAKTEFVSLASHQLRTPLTAINWFAEILLNGDVGHLKPKQANYVQEIYRGNQRMVELVNALLNVSRLELGTFMIEPKLTDIRKIADEAINDLENKVLEKKIKITKKYDKRIKEMMLDDKLTMIIFQNLLSNAVKYTPENGKVDLSIAVSGSKLLISVIDNGMGIPKAQQDKIFTKLFRADNVRATDTEGTGLGLYIIKSVVESVGGKIWFESEENKGTKFFVGLPLSGMKGKKGTKSLA